MVRACAFAILVAACGGEVESPDSDSDKQIGEALSSNDGSFLSPAESYASCVVQHLRIIVSFSPDHTNATAVGFARAVNANTLTTMICYGFGTPAGTITNFHTPFGSVPLSAATKSELGLMYSFLDAGLTTQTQACRTDATACAKKQIISTAMQHVLNMFWLGTY